MTPAESGIDGDTAPNAVPPASTSAAAPAAASNPIRLFMVSLSF
jgi:hypothetical protein